MALSPFYWNAFLSAALIAAVIFNLFGILSPNAGKHARFTFLKQTIAFFVTSLLGVLGLLTKMTVVYLGVFGWVYWPLFYGRFSFFAFMYCILRDLDSTPLNACLSWARWAFKRRRCRKTCLLSPPGDSSMHAVRVLMRYGGVAQ